jgi:hypothetical protein
MDGDEFCMDGKRPGCIRTRHGWMGQVLHGWMPSLDVKEGGIEKMSGCEKAWMGRQQP